MQPDNRCRTYRLGMSVPVNQTIALSLTGLQTTLLGSQAGGNRHGCEGGRDFVGTATGLGRGQSEDAKWGNSDAHIESVVLRIRYAE